MRLELEKKQREEETNTKQEISTSNRLPLCAPLGTLAPQALEACVSNPSCMNTTNFTTLHYDSHEDSSTSRQPLHTANEDSLDLYAIRDDCYPSENTVDNSHNPSRKNALHPEFNQVFQTFPGQQPSFQQSTYQDYQPYENLPGTSRPQFQQQFQSVTSTPGFPHYSPYQDSSAISQITCHAAQHPPTPIYDPTFIPEESHTQQYINLNSVQPLTNVVQQMGKLEPFSELLAGRYSYYGDVEPPPINTYHGTGATKIEEKDHETQQNTENSTEDCDENFGEIIKKSMVETVSA